MKEVTKKSGDNILINIASGGPVAAGKHVSQTTIIYQNTASRQLTWFQRLTLPIWVDPMWRSYCGNLAQTLSEKEGVDREFSELMAVLSPADLPIRFEDKGYLLSEVIDGLRLPRVIILGEPGSGKSTSLRHLAMIQARKAARNNRKYKIPVLAPLDTYTGGDILEFLQDKVEGFKSGQLSVLLPRYLQEGRMILFFDALNEMPGDQFLKNIRLILKAIDDYPRNRFVFTCRTEQYKGELKIPRAVLQPLDDALIEEFIKGYLGASGTAFFNRLQGESLLPLVRNPFFLWMVLRIGEVPKSKGNLIEQFVDTLFEREEGKGKIYRQIEHYPTPELKGILQYLAFQMMMKYRTTVISRDETEALIRDFTPPKPNSDFIQQGCDALILRFSDARKRNFGFWHQIIQEYFAAAYLDKQIGKLSDPEFVQLISDPWWWETLFIWVGVSEDQYLLISNILGKEFDAKRVIFANALFYNSGNTANSPLRKRLVDAMCRLLTEGMSKESISLILNLNELVGNRFFFEPCQAFIASLDSNAKVADADPAQQLKSIPAVIEVAGRLGGQDAVRVLFQIFEFDNNRRRRIESKVYNGLIKIGQPAVLPVLSLIYIRELEVLPPSFDLDLPHLLLRAEIPIATCYQIIGKIGEPAIGVLEEQIAGNPDNRDILLIVLKALAHIPETPAGCRMLAQWLGSEDSEINLQAVQGLRKVANIHAMPLLREILEGKNLLRKLAAIDVLGSLNSIQAVELLEKAAKDPSIAVQSHVLLYLQTDEKSIINWRKIHNDLIKDSSGAESYKLIIGSDRKIQVKDTNGENYIIDDELQTGIEDSASMTFVEHLEEMKRRLLRSMSAFWVMFLLSVIFFNNITLSILNWIYKIDLIPAPYWYFYFPSLLNVALLLTIPFFVYQGWLFSRPAFYPWQRKVLVKVVFIFSSGILLLVVLSFLISRHIVLVLNLAREAHLRVYIINKLGLFFDVLFGLIIIVRVLKRNPLAYEAFFSWLVPYIGNFALLLFGREHFDMLRYRLGDNYKSKLISKTPKRIFVAMALIFFIVIPIYVYLVPIIVFFYLTLYFFDIKELNADIEALRIKKPDLETNIENYANVLMQKKQNQN